MDGVGLNPFAPGFFANPYEQYGQLREHAPVYLSPLGPWILTRYDDCTRLLRDHRSSVEERRVFDRRALVFGADDHRWVVSWPIVFTSAKLVRGDSIGIALHPFVEPQVQPTRDVQVPTRPVHELAPTATPTTP